MSAAQVSHALSKPRTPQRWLFLCSIYTAICLLDAAWIYNLAFMEADPLYGRSVMHRPGFQYDLFVYANHFFGWWFSILNFFVARHYVKELLRRHRFWPVHKWIVVWAFHIFVFMPIALCLVFLPYFGGWLLAIPAELYAAKHMCDSYPLYVMLDGDYSKHPPGVPVLAHFYLPDKVESIFTLEAVNNTPSWTVSLRSWDVDQSSVIPNAYPTLQRIEYNMSSHTLVGDCALPTQAPGSAESESPCVYGTFTDSIPPLTLTSNTPRKDNLGVQPVTNTTTVLNAKRHELIYRDSEPYVILRMEDPTTHQLKDIVLRTAVQADISCWKLKLCVAGMDKQGTRELVGAEVLAPLGLIMIRHAEYSVSRCGRNRSPPTA